jgi:hypothetical protein
MDWGCSLFGMNPSCMRLIVGVQVALALALARGDIGRLQRQPAGIRRTAFITNYVRQFEHAALSCSKSVNCVHMYRSASDNRALLTSTRSSRVKLNPLQLGHYPRLRSTTASEWRSTHSPANGRPDLGLSRSSNN